MDIRLDLTNTNCGNLDFENRAKLVGDCDMGQIAESLAEASTNLSKEQTAGLALGMNVNTSVADRKNIIQQVLEESCGNEAAIRQNLKVWLRGDNLDCDRLRAINDADLTTKCMVNTVMQAVSRDEFVEASKQKSDILGGLTALLSTPVLIMGGLLIAVGIFFLLLRLGRGRANAADAAGTQALLPSEKTNMMQKINEAAASSGITAADVGAGIRSAVDFGRAARSSRSRQ